MDFTIFNRYKLAYHDLDFLFMSFLGLVQLLSFGFLKPIDNNKLF